MASGQPVVGNPGGAEGLGSVLQGYTEGSNVSVVNEFINLIVAQRTYEANSKVVKASRRNVAASKCAQTMTLFWFALLAVAPSCQKLDSGRITAGDFARVMPDFAALPADMFFGFSALPGGHRLFTAADVRRLAGQHQIVAAETDSVCFEWSMRQLDREEVKRAVSDALGNMGAAVEVEEL